MHLAEGGSRLGTDNFNRLMGMVRSARNDGFLNDGAVRNIVQDFGRYVSRPDPLTGQIEGPNALASARYQSQLIGSLAEYRRANPSKSTGEYLQWLQQEAERMLPSFVGREDLQNARARESTARESNTASYPRPPAPAAPGAPVNPTAPQGRPTAPLPGVPNPQRPARHGGSPRRGCSGGGADWPRDTERWRLPLVAFWCSPPGYPRICLRAARGPTG